MAENAMTDWDSTQQWANVLSGVSQATGQLPLEFPTDEVHVPVNSTVDGLDAARLSRQASDIFVALSDGPKFNIELVVLPTKDGRRRFIHNMTARISEIRNFLNRRGRDVLAGRLPDGIWLYKIGPCHTQVSSEHRIDVVIEKNNDHWQWSCPCCDSECSCHETHREYKQILKNPLCYECRTRLESPCPVQLQR